MTRRPSREINVLSMSALDLFCSALGVFILLVLISFQQARRQTRLEVVFVVDATDSMADLMPDIAAAIAGSVEMLREPVPDLAVGLVAYRDRSESFVTRELPLAAAARPGAAAACAAFLESAAAAPRRDNHEREEALGEGLTRALAMPWAAAGGASQVIVVVADAADHPAEAEATIEAARSFARAASGRRVHAVFCRSPEDAHAAFFRRLAMAGGGRCVPPMQLVELVATEALREPSGRSGPGAGPSTTGHSSGVDVGAFWPGGSPSYSRAPPGAERGHRAPRAGGRPRGSVMPGTIDDNENSADLETTMPGRIPDLNGLFGRARGERIISRGGEEMPPALPAAAERVPTMPEAPREVAGERARIWRPEHQLPVLSVTARRADGAPGQTFFVRDGSATCGREAGCDIRIANDLLLSKRHFELLRLEEEGEHFWEIRDLGSTGGLWIQVNEAWLYKSAEVCVGNTRLRFMPEPSPGPDVPQPARDVTGTIHVGSLVGGSVLQRLPREGVPGKDFTLKRLARTHWVGRNEKQCTVVCEDDEFVDDRHALVEFEDGRKRWRICDQGSTNGLWMRRSTHRITVEKRGLIVRAGEQVFEIKMDAHA